MSELRRISQEELNKILEEHKLWAESERQSGQQADLSKADLGNANLSNTDLRGAILRKANLLEANLHKARLISTDLSEAILRKANLSEAELFNTILSGANLGRADLSNANLGNAKLIEATLIGVNLKGSDLSGANLSGADLGAANLHKAYLFGAKLIGANLIRSDLSETDLRDSDLRKSDLRWANLTDANVSNVFYKGSKILCRGIRAENCFGSPGFKRFVQDQDFIEEFRASKRIKDRVFCWLWGITSDYGRSLVRWALLSLVMAVSFGLLFYFLKDYFHIDQLTPENKIESFFTMQYYSIVTFTTLGFGDVVPKNLWAAALVTCEVIFGYVMLGGLISIFANKLARRS